MRRSLPMLLSSLLMLCGCIQPHYHRPEVEIPPGYRGQSAGTNEGGAGLGELRWQELIHDEQLNELIKEALRNNYDARIAAARVLEASARAHQARSERFPTVDAQAGYNNLRTSQNGSVPLPTGYPLQSDFTRVLSSLSWELDLWGRIRNATTAARADLLATEESRRGVIASLVGAVADTYFLLRDLDLEKEITDQSLASRRDSLELVRLRVENGYSSEIDLHQAEGLVNSARTARTELEREIEQAENQLCLLLGRNPGPIQRGRSLLDQMLTAPLRAGLPSMLLAQRPDIRQAEQALISSNAQVAVAKAAFFPSISIAASTGFESSALRSILDSSNGTWVFGPVGNLPIFNAGRVRAGVRGAEARKEQAVLNYRRTVIQAFREVADALVAYRKAVELRQEQEALVDSLRSTVELADLRYRGGISSYLEYLDSEREFLDARLRLIQARRQELTSVIALYLGLGGGWR